jgi:SDR family mycofactocin-dependent oxidoreductase
MGLLDGKVVLITGGARGQGRAHALASAREGANVAVLDLASQIGTVRYPMATPDDLEETVRQVEAMDRRAVALKADVREQGELDRGVATVLAEFGHIDALVINHGIWDVGSELWNLSEEQWRDMLDVNLTGVWKAAKAVVPHMIERGSGSVVITASVNGLEPGSNYGHYSTSKHGAIGLARNLALELGRYGVRCNALAPGVIETPMIVNQVGMDLFNGGPGGTIENVRTAGSYYHALKGATALPPTTVADAGVWLNSDLAAAVTGVTIPVDAGHMLLTGYNHDPVAG